MQPETIIKLDHNFNMHVLMVKYQNRFLALYKYNWI